jgi:hypothetical protein
VIDVGDVRMTAGTELRGRVVTPDGSPAAAVPIHADLAQEGVPRGVMTARYIYQFASKADGTFRSSDMPAGRFNIRLGKDEWELVGPQGFEIAAGEREHELEIQVRKPAETEAIAGIVVDDAGNPVAKAHIDYEPMVMERRRIVQTESDGTFRIQRSPKATKDPVLITARRDGYESGRTETRYSWGATDAKVVLKRGLGIDIVVRDGDQGGPLERYGVRCRNSSELSSNAGALRERGAHPGGILRLTGVLRGRQYLIIEPEGPEWLPSKPRVFEMTDQGAPPQDITVWRSIKKTVRVKTAAGAPVAGTNVEIVRQVGEPPVDEFMRAVPIAEVLSLSEGVVAQLMSKGTTGDDGAVELLAPPREPLFLRALGPGHAPVLREVTIDPAGGDLELVVPKGATLMGTIRPSEFVKQLEAEPPRGRGGPRQGITLRRRDDSRAEFPLAFAVVPIAADATFRVEGVPPGTWDVLLRYYESLGESSGHVAWHIIGRVDLADGDERRETFDLSRLVKSEVEGVVTLDGKPCANAKVSLLADRSDGGDRDSSMLSKQGIALGPDGRFKTTVWPATYRMVLFGIEIAGRPREIYDSEILRAEPGQKIQRTFDLRTTVLKLRLLGSDGIAPAAKARIVVRFAYPGWLGGGERTDEEGRAQIYGLPAGEATVQVWPKRLSTDEAMMEFYRRPGPKSIDDVLVNVGTITIAPPETSKTITLPASTEY